MTIVLSLPKNTQFRKTKEFNAEYSEELGKDMTAQIEEEFGTTKPTRITSDSIEANDDIVIPKHVKTKRGGAIDTPPQEASNPSSAKAQAGLMRNQKLRKEKEPKMIRQWRGDWRKSRVPHTLALRILILLLPISKITNMTPQLPSRTFNGPKYDPLPNPKNPGQPDSKLEPTTDSMRNTTNRAKGIQTKVHKLEDKVNKMESNLFEMV